MKILGMLCSPRKGGNTEILLKESLTSASDCGAQTELLTLRDKNIRPCDGCYSCTKTGKCNINDDMQEIYDKFIEADGIIFGTPVYFCTVSAQAKIIIDRSYLLGIECKMTDKVGSVISVASSMGHLGVFSVFNTFFSSHHMRSADFVYGYARERGGILKDKHAMNAARELGRQIVMMIEAQLHYPKEYDIPLHRLVKRKYGISACPAEGRFDA